MNYQSKTADSGKKQQAPLYSSTWAALFALLRANWTQNQSA